MKALGIQPLQYRNESLMIGETQEARGTETAAPSHEVGIGKGSREGFPVDLRAEHVFYGVDDE